MTHHYPFGSIRATSGSVPTDYGFTGQRLDASDSLVYYGARYYDSALGRFTQPDTIIPQPRDPQTLNRFSYALNNPERYTDPTGHWTEEELEDKLGKNWRELYFGKSGAFEGRDELLKYLLSDQVTSPVTLELVDQFFEVAKGLHGLGLSFAGIDALGARVVLSGGSGLFGEGSIDAVLNLNSGQFSFFGTPGFGGFIGEGATLVGGITLMRNMPSNDDFRGVFEAAGVEAV